MPIYIVTDVTFPKDWNRADDFGVDKTLKFIYSPEKDEIEKLDRLVEKSSHWSKRDSYYHFADTIDGEELIRSVDINIEKRTVMTTYHRW